MSTLQQIPYPYEDFSNPKLICSLIADNENLGALEEGDVSCNSCKIFSPIQRRLRILNGEPIWESNTIRIKKQPFSARILLVNGKTLRYINQENYFE